MATKKKKKAAASTAKKKSPKKKAISAKKKPIARPKKERAAAAPKKKKKKAAAKAKPKAKAKAKAPTTARRDNAGHLDPQYEKDLKERVQAKRRNRDDDTAFLRGNRAHDDLAEELGEEAVLAMTSGEDQSERWEAEVEEESGGPFVKTRGREELARGTDKSNPKDATREPFPRT